MKKKMFSIFLLVDIILTLDIAYLFIMYKDWIIEFFNSYVGLYPLILLNFGSLYLLLAFVEYLSSKHISKLNLKGKKIEHNVFDYLLSKALITMFFIILVTILVPIYGFNEFMTMFITANTLSTILTAIYWCIIIKIKL